VGGGPVTRFIPGFARGEAGREEVETVEQVRAAYQQMISGKVLTEQEAKRLKVFLPHMGKTDTQNREDLERLREGIELNLKLFELGKREGLTPDQAYMKYGRQILGEQVVGGGDREEAGVAERAIDFLLGGALRTARDVGAGITANITEPQRKQAAEQAFAQAKELEDRAMATDNPEERVALLAEANKLHQSISQQAGEVSKSFTEDITTPYWQRGLEAGAEIGATAEIPAALSAVKKVAGEGVKKLPKLASDIGRQFGSTAQGNVIREAVVESAEAAGKKIPGDQIVKAVEKWGETAVKANPASENRITKFVEGAIKQHSGKDLTPKVAKELWDEANKGFNAAGTKGASLEASFHRTMRDVLRKELENIAPGFEKGTELIHKAMGRKTALKGFAGRAGSSAAGYVGAAAVMKALGMFEGK